MRHPSDWASIYLADVRCRSELMERTRRSLEEERTKAVQAGRHHEFDPKKPWDHIWKDVLSN
eukprot:5724400-Amphidinium_carterae.1